jgi:hypothetical protein
MSYFARLFASKGAELGRNLVVKKKERERSCAGWRRVRRTLLLVKRKWKSVVLGVATDRL